MTKLPQDFADLLIELHAADVEFLLVGGWAVILYGHVQATDEMDIFVRPSETNARRLVTALETFGAPLRAHGVVADHFAKAGNAYALASRPSK